MPSVIIKPTMTSDSSLAYQYLIVYNGDGYRRIYTTVDEVGFNEGALTLNINSVLKERLPENTYITNIKINLNIVDGRIGETHNLYVNGNNGKGTRSFYVKNTFKRGNNVFNIPHEANEFLINASSLTLYFDSSSRYILRSDRYNAGHNCVPNGYGGQYCGDEYKMPADRIVIVNRHTSTYNYPTIEVEYAFNPPEGSKSLAPNKETVNPRKPIRFSWDNKYTQTKFELQYRVGTGVWKSKTESTSNKFYVMPYNTITESEGVLEWRVRTAGESGVYSDWETASCELAVEAMQDPRIVTPSGDYIESSRPIRFEWQFVANAFEEQVSYELEYTLDKTLPKTTTIKGTTSDTFYVLEHDYNASTVGKWRIRVTNNYDEISEWTDWAEFNIMGAPPIPQIIEVSNTNIPTMKWNSKEQEVFEILIYDDEEVEVYDSKKIIGVEVREFTPNITLTNGKYKFVLRVYNKYNVASPQAEYTIIINPESIEPPTISVHDDDYCVLIKSNILDARVYRNEYHIGDLVNGEFYDYTGANNKLYNYKVRQIVGGVYSDSQNVSAKVNFTYDTLALLNKPNEYIKLDKSLNDLPEQQVNRTYDAAQHRLDGRKYELTEFSGLVRETIAIQYFVWFAGEVQKLLDANEEMIYRNTRGMVFIGTSLGLGYAQKIFGDDASFVMSKSRDEYD